ncbi:MAG: sugar O-acetyltransferase [Bacilli bacterium]|nr:sugar O-acetyltransferase [Bacilli bacterium]
MTEKAKMLAGKPYNAGDPELKKARVHARKLTEHLNRIASLDSRIKEHLIRDLFGYAGKNPKVEHGFHCDYGYNITVGDDFYANFNLVILDPAPVHIGDNCLIGPNVNILTALHPLDRDSRVSGVEMASPITIGNDCWIGANVTINPGVTLGNNVVVGSGSVVTKSFSDNHIIAGNPAKVIRDLNETTD